MYLLPKWLRLMLRPQHPRPKVVETGIDRFLQQRRVARVVAPQNKPARLDPIRRVTHESPAPLRGAMRTFVRCGIQPRDVEASAFARLYSHSMVAGGFELRSRATRFTPGISLMIRDEIASSTSYGSRAQSAVIASSDVTARITTGYAYVRSSPWTPTERIAGSTANDCHRSRYRPARLISSCRIESAARRISSRSAVTSPMIRIARPGPGNGWAARDSPRGRRSE